jgi:N-acetylneuraminate synthase/N,N'-diacetyllegionaminate synthase
VNAIEIGNRWVGPGLRCFIVAEAGVNHGGSFDVARRLVDAAVHAGADAVKFQTFKTERLTSASAPRAPYQQRVGGGSGSQRDLLKQVELPFGAFQRLAGYCRERAITFLSTPFDEESVDLLDRLGVPAFKVGSGEITNLPFLGVIARAKRPIILSTGMSYLNEVAEAVAVIRGAGNEQLVLLHCVSSYPTDPPDVNLRAMRTLEREFGVPVGFSDHTLGIEVAVAAVALGACLIEKHFTLDRAAPGPDHAASLEPAELAELVRAVRRVEAALGSEVKQPVPSELEVRAVARRSLHLRSDLPAGAILTQDMLIALRPAGFIAPGELSRVIGRRLRHALAAGSQLRWEDLE